LSVVSCQLSVVSCQLSVVSEDSLERIHEPLATIQGDQ
jgi:hypothetical protein